MGRPATVELEDVARAATRLISQGKRPTVDAIYDEVGRRGSRALNDPRSSDLHIQP